MGLRARTEYLAQMRDHYLCAPSRREKGRLQSEAMTVTGYHRKQVEGPALANDLEQPRLALGMIDTEAVRRAVHDAASDRRSIAVGYVVWPRVDFSATLRVRVEGSSKFDMAGITLAVRTTESRRLVRAFSAEKGQEKGKVSRSNLTTWIEVVDWLGKLSLTRRSLERPSG